MSKTPSLQLLDALFSAIAYFASERLPHFEIHQSTSGNQNQHIMTLAHQAKDVTYHRFVSGSHITFLSPLSPGSIPSLRTALLTCQLGCCNRTHRTTYVNASRNRCWIFSLSSGPRLQYPRSNSDLPGSFVMIVQLIYPSGSKPSGLCRRVSKATRRGT
jgi:hypothetical protein